MGLSEGWLHMIDACCIDRVECDITVNSTQMLEICTSQESLSSQCFSRLPRALKCAINMC